MRPILPWAERIRCCAPVSPQIFIITSWKDSSRERRVGARRSKKNGERKERAWVSDGEELYEYKQFWLMQSKRDERRTGRNGGLHGVMPWRTVKSLLPSRSTHTHPLLIPQFLSSRLQPSVPSLVFISASVMRTKETTHSFSPSPHPPFSCSWSLWAKAHRPD